MISVKNSYEIAYNGTENECRFEMYADTAADLQGLTHIDGIKIQMGSECTGIATGDKYILNGSGVWVLQPSANAWENVYTKAEIDSMITEIYDVIAYYHTTLISETGEIEFYSLGGNVGTWAIYGNGSQSGTPTPDNPVMPTFCGVRTANLLAVNGTVTIKNVSVTITNGHFLIVGSTNSEISSTNTAWKALDFTLPAGTYRFKTDALNGVGFYIKNYETSAQLATRDSSFTLEAETRCYIAFYIYKNESGEERDIMLNAGNTALPYEPYGYKIPITCAGQTNNVYMSAPLRKAIDGSDAVDTIDSSGTLTRNVDENGDALVTPTTETVSVPNIPTFRGENTLTVDTTLKPSKIEISGER